MLETGRQPKDLTHGIFRFPGRFHPPLVKHLLELHPEAKIVGDPMVGSGTVAVEATALGKTGIYSDVDPLSCLLTRAKSQTVDPDWLTDTFTYIINQAKPLAKTGTESEEAIRHIFDLEHSTKFRTPPNVFHWFDPYVVVNLCKVLQAIADNQYSSAQQDALLLVIAGVIRRISRADPNTSSGLEVTKVRLEALETGLTFDIAQELKRKAKLLAQGYRELNSKKNTCNAYVIEYDAKEYSSLCSKYDLWPDIIVTSPCYISAIEYWRRHKLEYCWLGLVPPEKLGSVKSLFLGMGAEEPSLEKLPKYIQRIYRQLQKIGRKSDANTLVRYFADSSKWLYEVRTVLSRTNGTAYVVVGSNTNHGITLDTPYALQQIAKEVGLSITTFMKYRITNSYMQYPTNSKRIKVESVLKLTNG